MRGRRLGGAAAAAALVLAAAIEGCGDGRGQGERSSAAPTVAGLPPRDVEEAVKGLCQVRAEAGTDVKSARTTFYDRSHEPLHGIARALEPVDHQQSALLLEAKAAVEADLDAGSATPWLTGAVDRLLTVTRASLARLSVTPPSCP